MILGHIGGIKENYPRLPLSKRVHGFFQLVRPVTLLPLGIVGLVGGLEVGLGWTYSILFGLLLVLMQAGGQSLNQTNSKEIEIDKLNQKGYRPTVSGILSIREARTLAYSCLVLGILTGVVIGAWWIGLLMASTAITYTEPPFYLKRFFPLNLLVQAFGRGFLPLFTPEFLTGKNILPLAVFFFTWVFALQSTKDFHDYEGDRKNGIQTLPVLLGKNKAKIVMLLITVVDYIFAVTVGLWFLLVIAPLDIAAILTCQREIKISENSIGWLFFYLSLAIGTVVGLAFV